MRLLVIVLLVAGCFAKRGPPRGKDGPGKGFGLEDDNTSFRIPGFPRGRPRDRLMHGGLGSCLVNIPHNVERSELDINIAFSEDIYKFMMIQPMYVDRRLKRAPRDHRAPQRNFLVHNRYPMPQAAEHVILFKYFYDADTTPTYTCTIHADPTVPPTTPTPAPTVPTPGPPAK